MARAMLSLFLLGLCSRAYGDYNQALKSGFSGWMDVVHGRANAPEQYRVGVVMTADWMQRHLHLRMSLGFGLMDLGSSLLAVFLLTGMAERLEVYRRGSATLRWFGMAGFVALTVYALDWASWYQRVTTLPTAGLTALLVWLLSPSAGVEQRARLRVAAFLAAVALLAFIRADIAVVLCLGTAAASRMRRSATPPMGRSGALWMGVAGALLAAGIQVYLMKMRYPQASYAGVPVFMLAHDWLRPEWMALAIFVAPFAWTVVRALRTRYAGEGAGATLLLAGVAYLGLWVTMGRLDEVRIFLPMALAVTPVTVEMAMLRVAEMERDVG
jgi:hypothetical protein